MMTRDNMVGKQSALWEKTNIIKKENVALDRRNERISVLKSGIEGNNDKLTKAQDVEDKRKTELGEYNNKRQELSEKLSKE